MRTVGYYLCRNSRSRHACRDVVRHHGAGPYRGIVAYFHVFHDTHMRANPHVIAYRGRRMFLAANVKKLADITIISNNGTRIDYDAYAMTDIQPVSYFYRPRYLHAIKARKPVMLKTGYDVKRIAQYFDEHKEVWADIDLSKIKVYYFTKQTDKRYFASRKSLDVSFTRDTIEKKVADTAIQKILLRHLENYGNDAEQAFSPDGIAEMNANIVQLNNGRPHQPIYKVRIYEQANKFAVGQTGNKASKFVEAAKGTNLFFAVYETTVTEKDGSRKIVRSFDTIPLNVVIERQKQGLPSVPDMNGNAPKFVLSPTDLVYVPTEEELRERRINMPLDRSRIYKMVSCTGRECLFVPVNVATSIVDKKEFSPLNKIGRALTGEMIKDVCLPIKVDRLGTVIEQPEF